MTSTELRHAYSQGGAAWQRGPARVYDRAAEVLVDHAPRPVAGRLVLDLGAGTGAASRALRRHGARTLACDVALGMLISARADLPTAVAADARALPLAAASVDGVVAAFALNHLPDPEAALAEAARILRPGGFVLASAYADDDHHPVKAAVEAALVEAGWTGEAWYEELRRDSLPRLATVEGALTAAATAGLDGATARVVDVHLPELGAEDLVAWRLGMPHHAAFVGDLSETRRSEVVARSLARLGDPPPLVRRMVVLAAAI